MKGSNYMKSRNKSLITAILLISIFLPADSAEKDVIKNVNKIVEGIESSINSGDLSYFKIENETELEISAPTIYLYYKGDTVYCIKIRAHHETWSTLYSFYFRKNKNPLKYLKVIESRPDKPPKEAIIYNKNGSILWQNVKEPNVGFKEILDMYYSLLSIMAKSTKY